MPNILKRDDYRKIKGMDRAALTNYLIRVWRRGYDTGFKAASKRAAQLPDTKGEKQDEK